ncbi:MAG TPA: MerR family transcriptional regulator [Bacteriovoracaceae bacterium]|nr:MerR family transcriptional regulator [Bacteriovoracaceae bacterium]
MASQLSGVASATIRAWEKRYQAVSPKRAENKHRLYSEKDIEKLSLLAKLTEFGQNIGKIARLDLEELKNVYSILMKKPYHQEDLISPRRERLNFDKTLISLNLAISSFKVDILSHELKKIRQAMTSKEVALNILPSIISMIENGKHSEGHQHALKQITSEQFSPYLAEYEYPFADQPPIILANPTNDPQKLSTLGGALLCMHYDKNFLNLGRAIPAKILADLTNLVKAESIILEVTQYQINNEHNLDHYLDELTRLQQQRLMRIYIHGPRQLQQSITRKNCYFIQNLQELDEVLLRGQL